MKNKLLLGVLLISAVGAFTGCSDDNDSNPTLIQPKEFKLNTPAYVNETVDLSTTEALQLSWSQPQYTADNAPINAVYEVQLSLTNSFTVPYAEALADESGATVADYIAIDKTSTTCVTDVAAVDFNKALVQLAQWSEDAVPAQQAVSVRVNAFVQEGTNRLNAVASNVVTINVNPYYVELRDAEPIMFYLIGDIFGDGGSTDAAYGLDAGPSPDAGRTSQRGHEAVFGQTCGHIFLVTCLQGLKAGQEGRIAVDRAYAGLQKTHFRISKAGHGLHKKISRRQAVGIKDGNKVSPGFCQAKGEIACLVACAFWSAQMTDGSVLVRKMG